MVAFGILDPGGSEKCMKDSCKRGKARVARIGTVSALLMTAVVILTPTVLATNHPYLVGLGVTWINNSRLGATVSVEAVPWEIDVEDRDSVTIYFNYSYSDSRTNQGNVATHAFLLKADYGGTWSNGHTAYTYGGGIESGSGPIPLTVYNVLEDTYIWVNYSANISCVDVPPYFDSASYGNSIYLY